jgi:general secretion pathway protein G
MRIKIQRGAGFTVIELIVVLAAIALLLSVAAPRYMAHLDTARETALREDLHQMRDAIDKFYGDQTHYPADLQELTTKHYLRAIPEDPITQRTDTWQVTAPADKSLGAVFDVHSGAPGQARDGSTYASW